MNSEIKLELGKTYISRDGVDFVTIVSTNDKPGKYRFIGDDKFCYTQNGAFYSPQEESPFDLVREVTPRHHP